MKLGANEHGSPNQMNELKWNDATNLNKAVITVQWSNGRIPYKKHSLFVFLFFCCCKQCYCWRSFDFYTLLRQTFVKDACTVCAEICNTTRLQLLKPKFTFLLNSSTSNDRFLFVKLFMRVFFLLTLTVFERKSPKKYSMLLEISKLDLVLWPHA